MPFQIYLSERLAEELTTEAERRRLSKAAIVRICLDRGLRSLRPLHQDPALRLAGLGAAGQLPEMPSTSTGGATNFLPGRAVTLFHDRQREVFIDSSFWVRLADVGSAGHRVAAATYRRVLAERRMLVTTDWVVAEAYRDIHAKLGPERAATWLDRILSARRVAIVYIDERILELTLRTIDRAGAAAPANEPLGTSLVDAASLVVMQQRGIRETLTCMPRDFRKVAYMPGIGKNSSSSIENPGAIKWG